MKQYIKTFKEKVKNNELVQRAVYEKTPPFWKKVGLVGGCIAGIGTLIVALPVSLPAGVVAVGTYLITAGGTLSGISIFAKY
jgi:uncharacterized membrane protein HdeD (DUF308 family)